jgi:AraC-like DNA-binding protein
MANANPTSAAMCDEMCASLIERRRLRAGTATLVRQVLSATSGDTRPSLANLAGLTSTSERTLRRRLHAEGTSFRAIAAATQADDAAELVGDKSLSITAIAERLGYADLSTFSQAFKRWHGVSPAVFRRTHASRG